MIEIPVVREPPAEKILRVGVHDFGYLTPRMPQEYLEALDLVHCRGVYLQSRRLQVLAHFPPLRYFDEGQNSAMLEYLANKRLSNGKFDRGVIALSAYAARESGVYEVPQVLRGVCKNIEFVVNTDKDRSAHVLFDREGRVHWVDSETIDRNHKYKIPEGVPNGYLVCATNGDLVPATLKFP